MRLPLSVTVATLTVCGGALAHPLPDDIDLSHLVIGDGKLSQAPKVGYIWPCRINPSAGGAFRDGPWIRGDGTYDLRAKATVDGEVSWPHSYRIGLKGDRRAFSTNDLPSHPTGAFPIAATDDAFRYDRNPNSIRAQGFDFDLPASPTLKAEPSCAPGAIGILITGVVLFNALDAPGRDAVAHETQDGCQGHPQITGVYHYHSVTTCLEDKKLADGHSDLVGYAIDGFGIYGRYGEGGRMLFSGDLDECHGHIHDIPWDGKAQRLYHYHATWDFPYTLGCVKGAFDQQVVMKISGGPRPGRGGPGGFGPPPPRF
jgi:hypothetical protein